MWFGYLRFLCYMDDCLEDLSLLASLFRTEPLSWSTHSETCYVVSYGIHHCLKIVDGPRAARWHISSTIQRLKQALANAVRLLLLVRPGPHLLFR